MFFDNNALITNLRKLYATIGRRATIISQLVMALSKNPVTAEIIESAEEALERLAKLHSEALLILHTDRSEGKLDERRAIDSLGRNAHDLANANNILVGWFCVFAHITENAPLAKSLQQLNDNNSMIIRDVRTLISSLSAAPCNDAVNVYVELQRFGADNEHFSLDRDALSRLHPVYAPATVFRLFLRKMMLEFTQYVPDQAVLCITGKLNAGDPTSFVSIEMSPHHGKSNVPFQFRGKRYNDHRITSKAARAILGYPDLKLGNMRSRAILKIPKECNSFT